MKAGALERFLRDRQQATELTSLMEREYCQKLQSMDRGLKRSLWVSL